MALLIRMEYFEPGDIDSAQDIACALIIDNETGTKTSKNYDVTLFNGRRKWKATEVQGVNPKKRIGWDILCTALHQLLSDRNFLPK